MGLCKNQSEKIRVNIDNFDKNSIEDLDFKIIIKPEQPNKIKLNNLDSLILDNSQIIGLNFLEITAIDYIDGDNLKPMKIFVYVQSTHEKIGQIEYFCAQKKVKKVTLIYTKFMDENSFPSYFTPESLEQYNNNNSMNQLFLDIEIDTFQFKSTYSTSDLIGWTNKNIIDSLNIDFFGNKEPANFSKSHDYFYITNLDIKKPNGNYLGGFHYTGGQGGVQVKFRNSAIGESAEEMTTHEFGHWLGLPHTWNKNAYIKVEVQSSESLTKDNFMDYYVLRKKWLKLQLLNYRR
jgi:hypothetical protein